MSGQDPQAPGEFAPPPPPAPPAPLGRPGSDAGATRAGLRCACSARTGLSRTGCARGVSAPAHPAYPAAVPPRGLLPWVLGFLIVIPFPFVGGLASGIAMAVSGGASRRAGGTASENARAALNWGLTYLMVSTLLLILHFVLLFVLTSQASIEGFYPLGIPITVYFALSLAHLVIVIIGTVRASSGRGMRVPFAIPFLRA